MVYYVALTRCLPCARRCVCVAVLQALQAAQYKFPVKLGFVEWS